MISGRSALGSAANHRPAAAACSMPRSDSGTSTSLMSMSISCAPASSAASRATLPWLCPCRTSHSLSGQFWRSGQFCRIRTSSCGRKLHRQYCARLFGGDGGRLLALALLIHAPERCQRLADDLVHVVITVGRQPPDESHAFGRIGKRLVALEQLLVLRSRDWIIRIALGRGI